MNDLKVEINSNLTKVENRIGNLRYPRDNTEENKDLIKKIIQLRNELNDDIKPRAECSWKKSQNGIESIIKLVDKILNERINDRRNLKLRYSNTGGDDEWLREFENHVMKLKKICKI